MRPLVWFRSDLRCEDNLALSHACADATRGVVGVFIVSPGEWRAHDWAGVKVDFTLRTLRVLSDSLRRLNIPLRIVRTDSPSDIPEALARLAVACGCDAVYFNLEYELNEHRRDQAVAARFKRGSLGVRKFHDQVLASPGTVCTGQGNFFTVFTPFKRAMLKAMQGDSLPAFAPSPRCQNSMPAEPDEPPGCVEGFSTAVPPSLWPAGEQEATRRLRAFVRTGLGPYKHDRDFPSLDGTSSLSPYLNTGAISVRQALLGALSGAGRSGVEGLDTNPGLAQWIGELLWREFYIHVTAGFPRVCMRRAFQPATERLRWRQSASDLHAWEEGRTGIPIVDAGMRQLRQTGWMHNRVRMIAAMFLSKNLFLDWRLGERFFMRHLVDGFLPSNNGGWQWSASTGTDAAPYFRVFNPISQSRTYDPDGAYIRRYVTELADLPGDQIHAPHEALPPRAPPAGYPAPIVNLSASRQAAIEAFRALRG